jgi:very-short-patch-repair endonuclease
VVHRGIVIVVDGARHATCALSLRSARVRAVTSEVLMFGRALVSPARAQLLEERARAMRLSPTRSEEWLWRYLSGAKIGFAFRRQLVIGNHIVDFACTKVRLVIEVDGPYHEERPRPDARRDAALAALGWHVFRVTDEEVVRDVGAVAQRIREVANRRPRVGTRL